MSLGFIVRRLLGAIPLLLGISLILFSIVHLAPGGPLDVYADNPSVSPEALKQIAARYGLDQPVPIQYVLWLKAMVTGDWGFSIRSGKPVLGEILVRLGPTLELGGLALIISLLIAIPLGIISASRRGSKLDTTLTLISFMGISTPVFWLALLLQLLFSVELGWLPSAGYQSIGNGTFGDRLAHLVMPAAVLSLATVAYAKGRSESGVVFLHALRNALIPAVTVIAVDFASVISGAVITETVFAWPGIGRLFMESMNGRDYPMLMGLMMMGSLGIVIANIVADLAYAALDPRIRYG